jgi:hypothetical protein
MLERWEGDFLARCIAGDADVDAAIAVLSSMDFIGFTGSLEDDMRRLLEKLGKPNVTVMLKRANPHPAVEDLSQEVRSALVRKTEADREVYAWALRHA